MATLKAAARKALPKSHAANAKARASQAVNEDRMSSSTKGKIDAKANKVLGKGKSDDSGDVSHPQSYAAFEKLGA